MMVQISGQYGDPKADDIFWPLQKRLNDCFNSYIVDSYFSSIVLLSIVFRVSGKITDFGTDGSENLKFIKKDKALTIDLVFPETCWRGVEKTVIKISVECGVRNCLNLLIKKAEELGEVEDFDGLKVDIDKALVEFRSD